MNEPYIQTPPSIPRIRDLYSWTTAWRSDVPEGRYDLAKMQDDLRSEFDRALAAHDRQIRADERKRIAEEALDLTVSFPNKNSGGWTEYIETAWLKDALDHLAEEDNNVNG